MTRSPNFFIIGAPKAGTTSMHIALSKHPSVFMSSFKEPHYFANDLQHPGYIRDSKKYLELFRDATDANKIIGESSVYYASSECAIANIAKKIPDAKLLFMLRNPIELAQSLHAQKIWSGTEDILDFETAWNTQQARSQGHQIPRCCTIPMHLQYGETCKIGRQLNNILSVFPKEQVHTIYMEDLRHNVEQELTDLQTFLDIPPESLTLIHHNQNKRPKSLLIHTLTRRIVRSMNSIRTKLPLIPSTRLGPLILKLNKQIAVRKKISVNMQNDLKSYFTDDISLLASLTNHDLTHWLS